MILYAHFKGTLIYAYFKGKYESKNRDRYNPYSAF